VRISPLNWGLAALVVVLVAAEVGLERGEPAPREVGRLFPELFADRAARIELAGGGEPLEIVLEGQTWVLSGHHDFPARPEQVERLLRALTSLTTLDLLSEDAASHDEYGVGADARRVSIWDGSGELLAGLVQGADVPTGNASYVRRLGLDQVYRAPRLTAIPAEPKYWLDRAWLGFEPALVTSVRISGPLCDPPLEFERREGTVDHWTRDGEQVSPRVVKDFAQTMRSLFLDEVVAPRDTPEALGPLQLRVEVSLLDGRELSAYFGATVDGGVLARRADDDWTVRLPQAIWQVVTSGVERLR